MIIVTGCLLLSQLERKRSDEKSERDRLNDVYLELVEKQRAYYKRVKEFQDVRRGRWVWFGRSFVATLNYYNYVVILLCCTYMFCTSCHVWDCEY